MSRGCNRYNYFGNELNTATISKFRQASAKYLDSIFQDKRVSFVMTSTCSTSEYREIIHFDAHFNIQVILINMYLLNAQKECA